MQRSASAVTVMMVIIPMIRAIVNWWTHDHHSPHPETSSGQKKKKKNTSHTLLLECTFCVFFYEWKRRLRFPKISGPTCRMNVMLIVTQVFLFSPEHWISSIITTLWTCGWQQIILYSLLVCGSIFKVQWLQGWGTTTIKITALTALYWHECWSTTGPTPPFWCLLILLNVPIFCVCLCDVWYNMYLCSGRLSTELFVFPKSGVSYLLITVWWYFCCLRAVYFTLVRMLSQIFLRKCYMLNSNSRSGVNMLSIPNF